MIERPFTQEQLHELRHAAELAWDDDTRHVAHRGHPVKAMGQCYVTAAWLQTLFGGHIARKDGHFIWLSQNKLYGLDLTGDGAIQPPADPAIEGLRLDSEDEGVHLEDQQQHWRSSPMLHQKVTHPAFSGAEVITPPASHARTALFCRRADRALEALRAGHKLSFDLGDAFPGEEPQYLADQDAQSPIHDDPFTPAEPVTYNVLYAQGEIHVSAQDSHDDLARHALIEPNHTGPFAAGYVTVDASGKANWQLRSNVALHALMRVLKDYGKTTGWQWGGLVDLNGEPVSDDFAPKRSQRVYYAYFDDDLVLCRERVTRDVQASLRDTEPVNGAIEVRGNNAIVNGLIEAPWMFESFKEWTDDEGLTLVAGDNVVRRIEDLQQFNLWSPTDNEPEGTQFFHEPHHDERSLRGPGGVYKCPDCERIFHDYRTYRSHQCASTPDANSSSDIDPAHTLPPIPDGGVSFGGEMEDFNRMGQVAVIRTSDSNWDAYVGGFKVGSIAVYDGAIEDLQGVSHVTDALVNRVQRSQPYLSHTMPDTDWTTEEVGHLTRMGFCRVSKTAFRWAKDIDPSKELDGAVPFIYDVQEDTITTGAPGGRHADIVGRFTPAGIVEGLYEPGGKIIIRTVTNMPYTVRHMLELWYYTNPQYVIKSVHLRDDEGQDTKLARSSEDYQARVERQLRGLPRTPVREPQPQWPYECDEGACTFNASELEGEHDGRYAEGWAQTPDAPNVWTPHAWLVDRDEHVLDPTWRDTHRGFTYVEAPHLDPFERGEDDDSRDWCMPTRRASQEVGQYVANLVASNDLVYRAYQALKDAGGRVYAVGGCVRDALLGKDPKDIDLMVTGMPAEVVRSALKRLPGRVDLTGKDFGVYRYRERGHEVEIALPRRERSTGAGHQDFEVHADHTMTPQEDLYRRDFTPNAMAVELDSGKLIDPFGGADDLAAGQFRTLGPKSLADDPLRSVRALVLRGRHGLEPDDETRRQLAEHASAIAHLPAERIQAELDKLFASHEPTEAISLAHDTGLLQHILPEVERAFGYSQDNPHHQQELGEHLLAVLRHTAALSDDPDLRMAALLHDIGKPSSRWNECVQCTRNAEIREGQAEKAVRPLGVPRCHICDSPVSGHYYAYRERNRDGTFTIHGAHHEELGADLARERLSQLKYPTKRIARMGDLVQHHMYTPFTSEKGARRFLARVGSHADDLLILRRADQNGKSEYPTDSAFSVDHEADLINAVRAKGEATTQANLAINGHDLIQHLGIPPGPQIGTILRGLTDAVIDNPGLNEREQLLQKAHEYV